MSRAAVEHISSRPSVPLHGRLRLPREKKSVSLKHFPQDADGVDEAGTSSDFQRLQTALGSVKRSDYILNSESHWWLAWLKSDWILNRSLFFLLWFPTQMLEHD